MDRSRIFVRNASPRDETRALDVMVLAFSTDPVTRWTWPDPQTYLENFPEFVTAFGGRAFAQGSAYIAGDYSGAALWLAPGTQPNEDALVALFEHSVPKPILKDVFDVLEQMGRYHPSEPHWYLPLMGVDPSRQGSGYGSALMQHALAECDRDGMPAYLESTNPRNLPLYERHGFEHLGTIQAGSSPPLFPMLRKPRARPFSWDSARAVDPDHIRAIIAAAEANRRQAIRNLLSSVWLSARTGFVRAFRLLQMQRARRAR
jgi:GNAT superfamily N-acetyltransferase